MIVALKCIIGLNAVVLVWTVDGVASYVLAAIAAAVIITGPNGPESDRP